MRRKIALYIADQLVDLDDQTIILFNYTMEDLSNPTTVKNSFSKSITLKGTPNNNKIFGDVFRLDRVTQYGESQIGINYNATRKTPFVIYNEMNEILESGYMKLDKIGKDGHNIEYNITLYGGLGSFFYGLMYNEDGNKKSLADLVYVDSENNRVSSFNLSPDVYYTTYDAWKYLKGDVFPHIKFWNIINFAPAYNGIPKNFDASRAIFFGHSPFANVVTSTTVDGIEYGLKSNANSRLMIFTNPHTEWEVRDLRWYLQRPVMSIKSFVNAICDKENNGGFDVVLDSIFFNEDNPYYEKAWFTLPMISEEFRNSTECLNEVLKSSLSPMEIFLSFTKVFGLCFQYDNRDKRITIMPRKSFYQAEEIVDLTKRIDRSSKIEITPFLADSLYYQFGGNAIGQYADEYKKLYDRDYGIQRVNTGVEFNSETTILTEGSILKDAAEVTETNRMFCVKRTRYGSEISEIFLLPAYERVVVQLWNNSSEEEQSVEVEMNANPDRPSVDNPLYEFADWLPKVQLHKNNTPEDGAYVMLFFDGTKETTPSSSSRKKYWLTNDHPDMALLNQGKPCWNLRGAGEDFNVIETTNLPSFRRNLIGTDGKTIEHTWEWGVPFMRGVPGIEGNKTIYSSWWQKYLTDLYDKDTKLMKCKVDLTGLFVNQSLLRKFYWYENAIWRLNKIDNHSLTTYDMTECEFIKVQDINNYIG